MTPLEGAVIERMLADPQLAPTCRNLDSSVSIVVEDRILTEVGFITSFVRNDSAKFFSDDTSIRWGKVVGRLNFEIDVDFVVYVDDGYLDAVEGVTFGGESWPSVIEEFELTDVPNR